MHAIASVTIRRSGLRKPWEEGPGKWLVPQESLHYPRQDLMESRVVDWLWENARTSKDFRQANPSAYPGSWDLMMQVRGLFGLHSPPGAPRCPYLVLLDSI
jgi:hypothetical protein